MEIQKPLCEYGSKCYRKNPKHLESFSHPDKPDAKGNSPVTRGKNALDSNGKKGGMKQTTLHFSKRVDKNSEVQQKKKIDSPKKTKVDDKAKGKVGYKRKKKDLNSGSKEKTGVVNKKARTTNCFKVSDTESDGSKSDEEGESVPSTSWVFIKNDTTESKPKTTTRDLANKSPEEIIKILFLLDMPPDFYNFYEFCKSFNENNLKSLQLGDLNLVGPFDVLLGNLNYTLDEDLYLCHWRFFYDPPEFQTVLADQTGFHIGYWRDDPNEDVVFVASNDMKDCSIKIEAENIFGAVFHYLTDFMKKCDPFKKIKIGKLQTSLSEWAEKNKYSLEKKTSKIIARQKKIVTKTFHGAGIVVPVEAKTEVGYRPLIETNANLKKICTLIMKASDESERESLWENLQPLITAANIANDECDFGNSLELGIDLFCMGSPVFHETVEHLLSTAYSLLNRTEFKKIIKAHLKFRRKSNNVRVDDLV